MIPCCMWEHSFTVTETLEFRPEERRDLLHSKPCNILFHKEECHPFLYQLFSSFGGLCITQFALGIERAISSTGWIKAEYSKNWTFRVLVTAITVLLSLSGPVLYAPFLFEDDDEERLHCAAIILAPQKFQGFLFFSMLGFEALAAVFKKSLKKSNYSVSNKMRVTANLRIIKMFVPHLFTSASYFAVWPSLENSATLSFLLYGLPYYALLEAILLVSLSGEKNGKGRSRTHRATHRTKVNTPNAGPKLQEELAGLDEFKPMADKSCYMGGGGYGSGYVAGASNTGYAREEYAFGSSSSGGQQQNNASAPAGGSNPPGVVKPRTDQSCYLGP